MDSHPASIRRLAKLGGSYHLLLCITCTNAAFHRGLRIECTSDPSHWCRKSQSKGLHPHALVSRVVVFWYLLFWKILFFARSNRSDTLACKKWTRFRFRNAVLWAGASGHFFRLYHGAWDMTLVRHFKSGWNCIWTWIAINCSFSSPRPPALHLRHDEWRTRTHSVECENCTWAAAATTSMSLCLCATVSSSSFSKSSKNLFFYRLIYVYWRNETTGAENGRRYWDGERSFLLCVCDSRREFIGANKIDNRMLQCIKAKLCSSTKKRKPYRRMCLCVCVHVSTIVQKKKSVVQTIFFIATSSKCGCNRWSRIE